MHLSVLTALLQRDEDQNILRIIRWLAPLNHDIDYFERDRERELEKRHASSCEWVLASPQYQTWISAAPSAHESLLWISAAPGAGKTILSSFLVDHL